MAAGGNSAAIIQCVHGFPMGINAITGVTFADLYSNKGRQYPPQKYIHYVVTFYSILNILDIVECAIVAEIHDAKSRQH